MLVIETSLLKFKDFSLNQSGHFPCGELFSIFFRPFFPEVPPCWPPCKQDGWEVWGRPWVTGLRGSRSPRPLRDGGLGLQTGPSHHFKTWPGGGAASNSAETPRAGWQEPRSGPRETLPRGGISKRYPLADVWVGGCRRLRASLLRWGLRAGSGPGPRDPSKGTARGSWALGEDQMGQG